MKSLALKPLTPSSSSPSLFLLFSQFSTFSNFPSHSSSSSFASRRHEEESRNVRVSVWWDFQNCIIPVGANVFKVAQNINAAIRANGIKGPIQITAFGDMLQLSRANQEALSATGINLTHIPHGGKNSSDRSLLLDLMYWVSQNPPPAHLFLISGDRDFASILHRLRMNNYNILLASTESAPNVLCSAASIMWHWHALVRGENLTGKYFNQPPDGPYGSWYGHYKVPLEDPFSVIEQPTCTKTDELSETGSENKPSQVPKAIMKLIRHILSLHPNGISASDLRSELGKSNETIDKDYYGHKKFSRFLLSMPRIVKLQCGGDGQLVVHGVTLKAPEPELFESTPDIYTGPVINNGDVELELSSKLSTNRKSIAELPSQLCSDEQSINGTVNLKSPLPASPKLNVEEPPKKRQMPSSPSENVVEVFNDQVTEGQLLPTREEQDSTSETGFRKNFWKKWFGGGDSGSEKKGHNIPENIGTSIDGAEKKSHNTLENGTPNDRSRKTKVEEKCVESTSQDDATVRPESLSSSSNETARDDKTAVSSQAYGDKSSSTHGFFKLIVNWCKFWRSGINSDTSIDQSSEIMNQTNSHSGKHELFFKDSFWSEMESYMDTPKASILITLSGTREQMAQNLQKEGPPVLRSLGESDLLCLMDLLISEKKWVEECPSQTSPFKLTLPVGKSYPAQSLGSNGLSSIFLRDKKIQNTPHAAVSLPSIITKPSDRSRSEILADCQKLVKDILKEFPGGYNMGCFRKMFRDRYGYSLDLQMLGYQKLAPLLQTMPGVKVESAHIIPSRKALKGSNLETASELSDASKKNDDTPWEELGPVANSTSDRNELKLALTRKIMEEKSATNLEYESSISDNDFSDSEEENSTPSESGGQGKARVNEDESSLLQVLDSWYSSKEGDNGKNELENVDADGRADCSRNGLKPSDSSIGSKRETCSGQSEWRQKPQRRYSFVADPVGNGKDKLIDGILGSLKKSGESRMQS